MSVFKDVRFIALIVLAFAAGGLLGVPSLINTGPVTVDVVDPSSTCGLSEGDVINQIYSTVIVDAESFEKSLRNVRAGDRVTMVVNSAPFGCTAPDDKSIGVVVKENKIEALTFGIDIEGGTRVILSPTEQVTSERLEETVKTMENRINFFGLREVKVNTLGSNLIQIEMSGATGDDVRDFLARQGVFEGKLEERIRFSNGTGVLIVDGERHSVFLEGGEIVVEDGRYSANETFVLDGETFNVISVGNSSALVYADLFTGDDIVNVLSDSQNSRVVPVGGGAYEFAFGIQVSRDGAERFEKLTKGHPAVRSGGTSNYIDPRLVLFLDDRLISELNIASTIAGQAVTTAVISGVESSLEEANQEKLRLESTLRSGSLPVKLNIEKIDTITETSGRDLINSTILVAVASVIAVGAIVSYRYREYKIVVPMVLISLSEILIVVGMASNQIFAGIVIGVAVLIGVMKREVTGIIGWVTLLVMIMVASTITISPWTIDIPVIAGLIAILGTGVNQMIIMTDQLFKEKGVPLNERRKSAMQLIWSSAATVVFAMIPLILIGVGALKGFAIATIIGVLVGILITRPAYVALVEKVKRSQLESV